MEKLGPGDPQGIGAYRLLARLGAGGMGHVYLARSDRGRTVAVKLVRAELARQEEFRARFRHEVRAARQVGGFWTAPVLDADTEAAVPWVATGYVAGPSLEQIVGHDHGALPERSVRILAAGLAHALKDIHAAGIVHRDLKPSNVLVTIDGPRVIDFGIARALETVTDAGRTRTGVVVGSPGFMAPEQVRGDRVTPACDIFCLGSVLAYAATGGLPFGTADSGVHALMFRIAQEEPDLTGVPEGIAELVRDCLQKDPAARPTLDRILERTGAEDTVTDGRSRDPWLPASLVAQLGRQAVRLLDTEDPTSVSPVPPTAPPGVAAGAGAVPGAPMAPGSAGSAGGTADPGAPGGSAASAAAGPAGPPAPVGTVGPVGPAGPVAPVAPAGPVPGARPESAAASGGAGQAAEQSADGGQAAAREGDPRQASRSGVSGAGGAGGTQRAAGPAHPSGPPSFGPPPAAPPANSGPLADLPTVAAGRAGQAAREDQAGRTPSPAPTAGPPAPTAGPPAPTAAPRATPAPGGTPPGLTAPAPPGPGATAFPGRTVQPAVPAPGPTPGPVYGFPHQSAPAPAPAWPGRHHPGVAPPPYGPPPAGSPPHPHAPHGAVGPVVHGGHPQEPAHGGNSRSTVLLVVIALLVALVAGGTVYALMNRGNGGTGGGAAPSPTATGARGSADPGTAKPGPGPTTEDSPSPSPSTDGAVPTAYLGTWTTTIDNASGRHTRELTITRGGVGDTVLSLVAEGPADGGSDYHCVFVAELSEDPGEEGPLAIGPSTVRTGPATACSPGAETEVTLLPDGTLERVNAGTGERLVYRKE